MSRSFEKLSNPQNVVTGGGRVTMNLPLGLSYDQVCLKLTNITLAQITNIKVIAGARALWEVATGTRLGQLNDFYNRPETAGFLTFWFYRPELATEEERKLTSLGTLDIPSLTIQFDLDAAVTSPAIEAYAIRRAAAPLGLITKIKEYPTTFATSGKQDIDNIVRGARISAMHIFKADVSNVELEINNGTGAGKLVDMSKEVLEAIQAQYGRVPVTAACTHVDLNLLGKLEQLMPTHHLKDMRLKPTIDTSGALTTVVEYIDGYQGV